MPDRQSSSRRTAINDALLRQATRLTVEAGAALFHQGEAAGEMFAIESGRVKLTRSSEDGVSLTLGYYDGGDYVGSIAVLQDRPHSVTATAVEELTVLVWPATLVRRVLQEDPTLAAELAVALASRAEGLVVRVEDLSSGSVEARIARVLLRYRIYLGEIGREAGSRLDLTQREIAELTLTTVPTVSRTLKRWRAAGIVSGSRGHLTIVDPQALAGLRGAEG